MLRGGGGYKEAFRKEASLMSERCQAHMDNPDYNTSTVPTKTKGTSSSKRDKWHEVKSQQKFMRLARKQVAKILEIVLSNFLI